MLAQPIIQSLPHSSSSSFVCSCPCKWGELWDEFRLTLLAVPKSFYISIDYKWNLLAGSFSVADRLRTNPHSYPE
jgi:hypothetical protein